ncbi:DNA replication and repair protein RecO [Novosphingobium kunmingense]|uniref:DNA replication and repair protein RecO n=1 Tax=Novosphingobium kunmingense TaxID=1211806 RepID=A0A2N0I3X9_9SPHN|nr:recombination protein O N-terminal domain-containing protein [Novosphingobium kunmingense]PKB25881.1 DNA replication and repair protein RecO [Novosphingobium kunmingense]
MELRTPAIVCAVRQHGETAAIVRLLTEPQGMVAAYVAGARGRVLRPVLLPGNLVQADIRSRSDVQLAFARLELLESRGAWLTEPLPAAALAWVTALAAATLPERQAYPSLFQALSALAVAICQAPSARGWLPGLIAFETLLLRELGYGGSAPPPPAADWTETLAQVDRLGQHLERYLLADRRADVMGARALLRERLGRMG